MSRLTSKYQVSIPKALARRVGVKAGDELHWEQAGDDLRARIGPAPKARFSTAEKLGLFDAATARQQKRERERRLPRGKERGWKRADLYAR